MGSRLLEGLSLLLILVFTQKGFEILVMAMNEVL